MESVNHPSKWPKFTIEELFKKHLISLSAIWENAWKPNPYSITIELWLFVKNYYWNVEHSKRTEINYWLFTVKHYREVDQYDLGSGHEDHWVLETLPLNWVSLYYEWRWITDCFIKIWDGQYSIYDIINSIILDSNIVLINWLRSYEVFETFLTILNTLDKWEPVDKNKVIIEAMLELSAKLDDPEIRGQIIKLLAKS